MISRRKFVSIVMMMVVLFLMFQILPFIRDVENKYDYNSHIKDTNLTSKNIWSMDDIKAQRQEAVIFIGNAQGKVGKIVEQWCNYQKANLYTYETLDDYLTDASKRVEVMLLEGTAVDYKTETDTLKKMITDGLSVVFCNLPDYSVVEEYPVLKEILGIKKLKQNKVEALGIKLFEGFLLGGEAIYYTEEKEEMENRGDMELVMPWYQTASGTKSYMVGIMTEDIKNEDLPPVIWRNSLGKGKVFVVNGAYMEDCTGIGFLSAIMAELHSYEIYPVINAQNLTIANYPGFADENDESMKQIYSRSQSAVLKNLVWPALVSVIEQSKLKMTCFMFPQYNYRDDIIPSPEEYEFYLKQLNEQDAEVGLSIDCPDDILIKEKIEADKRFLRQTGSRYEYATAYVLQKNLKKLKSLWSEDLSHIQTLSCEYQSGQQIVSYVTENIMLMECIVDGFSYTYSEDLRMRSIQTALGYTNILLDMKNVAWPASKEDYWEKLYEKLSSNANTYWKDFDKFTATTLSEGDARARNFLALDYDYSRTGKSIHLSVSDCVDICYFILRTHGETINEIKGGTYIELEEGAYLIAAEEEKVEIVMSESKEDIYDYIPR